MKDLFRFLQKLFNYHYNSAVVSSVYREAVKVLQITGANSVIRVNGTRWIFHTFLTLKNLLNSYQAHINIYNELQLADKYSAKSKAQAVYFSRKLNKRDSMEFAIHMVDILSNMSAFSKVSQERDATCADMSDSLTKCLDRLQLFYDDSERGENWKKRDIILGKSSSKTLDVSIRKKVVQQLRAEISSRCTEIPPEADTIKQVLKVTSWKHETFFAPKAAGSLFATFSPTDIYNKEIEPLTKKPWLYIQLESKGIDVNKILPEWVFLKGKMAKWSRSNFPLESWAAIGEKFEHDELQNLFELIDFFLTLTVSSAEAGRGFSALKLIKTSKRAVLTNKHPQRQMQIYVDGPEIEKFQASEAIDYWENHPSSRSQSGKSEQRDQSIEILIIKSLDQSRNRQKLTFKATVVIDML